MAKLVKHPTFENVTSETHPNLLKEDGKTWYTQEERPKAFYGNGKPRRYISPEARAAMLANAGPRRSDAESLAFWQQKKVDRTAAHAKELAAIDKKIAYFSGERTRGGVDPEKAAAAVKSLVTQGVDPSQFAALAEQFRLAAAAVKGKSEDEIKALVPPPFAPAVPPMPGAPAPALV